MTRHATSNDFNARATSARSRVNLCWRQIALVNEALSGINQIKKASVQLKVPEALMLAAETRRNRLEGSPRIATDAA
jgi:hypothetical protein